MLKVIRMMVHRAPNKASGVLKRNFRCKVDRALVRDLGRPHGGRSKDNKSGKGYPMNINPPVREFADGAGFQSIEADLDVEVGPPQPQEFQTSVGGDPRWYLIQCRPREDERALENLERQEYQCYAPSYIVERWRQGRRLRLSEPLFPGYLFIHLDRVNDNWRPIRSTRGVNRIVSFNGEPPAVPDEIIEGIRTRLNAAPLTPRFRPGERVRVTKGPFAEIEAIFVATKGEERVILLLDILQQEQRLSFPASSVVKLRS
jgi:transcriptional antiterminator RfaH